MPHIIQLDSRTLALVNKNDVSDCIETNSEIGVDQFGREKKILLILAWANDLSDRVAQEYRS